MSVKALTWAFGIQAPSPGAKFALVALADSADDDGIVILGRRSLAAKCQVAAATSTAHLKALEATGLIWRKERRRKNGSRTSDWIVLAPEAEDRSPMLDATSEKHEDPDLLAKAQVRKPNPGATIQGSESDRGQVRFSGGPYDPSEDPSSASNEAEGTAAQEELVPDPLASLFQDWFVAKLTKQRGVPPTIRDRAAWSRAARELVAHPREELKAVVGWGLKRGWVRRKMTTLPMLARNYADIRGDWSADQELQREREAVRNGLSGRSDGSAWSPGVAIPR